jgi:hypothetical protein
MFMRIKPKANHLGITFADHVDSVERSSRLIRHHADGTANLVWGAPSFLDAHLLRFCRVVSQSAGDNMRLFVCLRFVLQRRLVLVCRLYGPSNTCHSRLVDCDPWLERIIALVTRARFRFSRRFSSSMASTLLIGDESIPPSSGPGSRGRCSWTQAHSMAGKGS